MNHERRAELHYNTEWHMTYVTIALISPFLHCMKGKNWLRPNIKRVWGRLPYSKPFAFLFLIKFSIETVDENSQQMELIFTKLYDFISIQYVTIAFLSSLVVSSLRPSLALVLIMSTRINDSPNKINAGVQWERAWQLHLSIYGLTDKIKI